MIYTKSIITLFVILLLTACNNNQHSEFKGDIESISEKTYSCSEKFGEIIKEDLIEGAAYSFENKNIIKYIRYDNEGEKKYISEYQFKNEKPFSSRSIYSTYDSDTRKNIQVEEISTLIDRKAKTERWLRQKNGIQDTVYYDIDKFGYRCIQKEKDIQGNIHIFENTRDNKGNLIEFKHSTNNEIDYIVKSKYDVNNLEIEKKSENIIQGWKDYIKYKYKIDDIGNWTERIEYTDDEPTKITIREIKYN